MLKKIGLSKEKAPVKVEDVKAPSPSRNIVTDTLPDGTVLTGPGGKTYTIGQKGPKPFWFQESVLKHQGVTGVKPVCVAPESVTEDSAAPEQTFGRLELKNALVLQKQSRIMGDVSFVYEIDNKKQMCFVSDEAEMILPKNAKIWRVGGAWSIL